MIDEETWNKISKEKINEEKLLQISEEYKIPVSFIIGRLARTGNIKYNSRIYQKYSKI